MTLSAIVAISQNNIIGLNNGLPWHLPEDLKHFKQTTTGHTIVMGRKTFESIKKPLPNRTNVILTSNKDFSAEGVVVINNLENWLKTQNSSEEIFIVGGAGVYKLAWPLIDKIYLTLVEKDVTGDTNFPFEKPLDGFTIVSDTGSLTSQNGMKYKIIQAIKSAKIP